MNDSISRISKLFVDRDHAEAGNVLDRRKAHGVVLRCGDDVAGSYTLQAAVLTAARIASRCFPNAVEVVIGEACAAAPLLLWPSRPQPIADALKEAGARGASDALGASLIFGDVTDAPGALRVTFDGWSACVGPSTALTRAREREYFPAAGVLAAALAMSELFLAFANMSIAATRRTVGLSLWRPDLDHNDEAALGIPVTAMPRDLFLLGLGHLGNAYLWTLACLPYAAPEETRLCLFDFDEVSGENFETSLLFQSDDSGRLKTRVSAAWLEDRGFPTRLVERRFGADFRRYADGKNDEPALALCGFDSNAARRSLDTAQFSRVIETGLGGHSNNFDTVAFHTLPNPRSVHDLWPDPSAEEQAARARRLEAEVEANAGYRKLSNNVCGRAELAGKAIAVPFVGAIAASLVVAELARLFHDGASLSDAKLSLSDLSRRSFRFGAPYTARDLVGLPYTALRSL